jgi:hypothetical protein
MTAAAKIIIIVFCISLCGGGIIFNSRERTKSSDPKTQIVPVINRPPQRGIWLRV